MSQSTQGKVTAKALQKTIKASIKREISVRGINVTTRRGNKELKFLTQKIAGYSFENLEQARIAGEKLGQHLSELFQQRKKPHLDGSLIRQVTFQNNIWARAGLSAEETLPKETVERQEDASQIPVTQTTEDRPMATEVVAIEEAEKLSVTDSVAQAISDKNESTEHADEITTQASAFQATEGILPTNEAETNSEAEEISITDSVAQELPDNNETAESTDEIATSEKSET